MIPRLWREGGTWRVKTGKPGAGSTYWGPLRGAIQYWWRSM